MNGDGVVLYAGARRALARTIETRCIDQLRMGPELASLVRLIVAEELARLAATQGEARQAWEARPGFSI